MHPLSLVSVLRSESYSMFFGLAQQTVIPSDFEVCCCEMLLDLRGEWWHWSCLLLLAALIGITMGCLAFGVDSGIEVSQGCWHWYQQILAPMDLPFLNGFVFCQNLPIIVGFLYILVVLEVHRSSCWVACSSLFAAMRLVTVSLGFSGNHTVVFWRGFCLWKLETVAPVAAAVASLPVLLCGLQLYSPADEDFVSLCL